MSIFQQTEERGRYERRLVPSVMLRKDVSMKGRNTVLPVGPLSASTCVGLRYKLVSL